MLGPCIITLNLKFLFWYLQKESKDCIGITSQTDTIKEIANEDGAFPNTFSMVMRYCIACQIKDS